MNRLRTGWSWIADDSYQSAAGREAGRLTKIISAGGRLSQPGRVNVAAQSVLVQLVASTLLKVCCSLAERTNVLIYSFMMSISWASIPSSSAWY